MSERQCLFCEEPLSRSIRAKEDVLPKWLLRHLGLKTSDQIRGSHITDLGLPLRPPRLQGAHTILQGSVCDTCNNQWMSKLETRVRPTVKAFSVGDSLALAQDDTARLSAWILKTLALYNITSNYRSLVDPKDFRHLYQQRLPSPGRHIELAYLPADEPSVFRTRMAPIKFLLLPLESDKEEITRRVDRSSFVLTMQIGELLLQAVSLPRFGMWGRTDERRKDVLRIYPQIPESVIRPPRFGFDGSIDDLNAQVGLRLLFS
jgi:hypothetical protein